MLEFTQNDTICAIATPPGTGGVGVIRVSGPRAHDILTKMWRGAEDPQNFEPRKLYLGNLADINEAIIDRVMAVFMPAPNSYTGENVVEFSCHGSPVILGKILQMCIAVGVRVAAPGEFTRRAFMAGKLDLVQAEGVADLIHATSERAARVASAQLTGELSSKIKHINDDLTNLRAEIEASIDFPEEDIDVASIESAKLQIEKITKGLEKLSSTFQGGRLIREGVRVAIVGRPNAGKSSIFNRLVGENRAIVHHTAGTTRDVIEESVVFGGMNFKLRDTAGIREGTCEVEAIGVDRARHEIDAADITIAVIDGSSSLSDEDRLVLSHLKKKSTIIAINKMDLLLSINKSEFKDWNVIQVSALSGSGIENLISTLIGLCKTNIGTEDGLVITNVRHKSLIDEAVKFLNDSLNSISNRRPLEFVVSHLQSAQDSLGGITGEVTSDDILNQIFSKFCIGK